MVFGPLVEMNDGERTQREIDSSMANVMHMAARHQAEKAANQ